MAFNNIFKLWKPGTPARTICNIEDENFMRNVFNDIQGVNCRIDKPTHNGGMGWRIVIGDGSDVERPSGLADPFSGSTDQSFKVTHDSGNSYSISGGQVNVLNQSVSVSDTTISSANTYIRMQVHVTTANVVDSVNYFSKANESDTNTDTQYWYTVAEVSSGVTRQRLPGDIYDRNTPTFTDTYDVVTHDSQGRPFTGPTLAQD
jgi:hypothetical protein